jgi:hypothetical protein
MEYYTASLCKTIQGFPLPSEHNLQVDFMVWKVLASYLSAFRSQNYFISFYQLTKAHWTVTKHSISLSARVFAICICSTYNSFIHTLPHLKQNYIHSKYYFRHHPPLMLSLQQPSHNCI